MTETEALVVLNAVPGFGAVSARQLIDHFGSAAAVLDASPQELAASGIISSSVAQKIFDFPSDTFLKNEYNLVAQYGVRVVGYSDETYPPFLREIHDAPLVLYSWGIWPLAQSPAVAIVGSRQASIYGMQVARKFAGRLAEVGLTVVSGLARGIDAAAHEGCLSARGTTIAVLGSGLARIYPPEHKGLAKRIVQGGAILSEFPMTMPPLAYNFPRRNRIISGLSLGVVVVEASQRSGALITTRFALEQGREVFAVPGQIDNPNSRGVHDLIQQGAKLIYCPEDILEELASPLKEFLNDAVPLKDASPAGSGNPVELSDDEQKIFSVLKTQPTYLDVLIEEAGLPRVRVVEAVLNLELKQRVRQLPGQFFKRI